MMKRIFVLITVIIVILSVLQINASIAAVLAGK